MRLLLTAMTAMWLVAFSACPAEPVGGDQCSDDNQCTNTQVCRFDHCRETCNSRRDCMYVEVCYEGYCMPEADVSDANVADVVVVDAAAADASASDAGALADVPVTDTFIQDALAFDHLRADVTMATDADEAEASSTEDAAQVDGMTTEDAAQVDAMTADSAVAPDSSFADSTMTADAGGFADAMEGPDTGTVLPEAGTPLDAAPSDASIEDQAIPDLVGVDLDIISSGVCQGFPRSQTIFNLVRVNNAADLEALRGIECIEKDLLFRDNGLSVADQLESLQVIGGTFELKSNFATTDLNLPALHSLGNNLNLEDDSALLRINLASLTNSETLRIRDCAALISLNLPSLTTSGHVDIYSNAALESISMPLLSWVKDRSFEIQLCDKLQSIDFPALARVDNNFEISANPLLPNCDAILLKDQVMDRGQIGGSIYISGNDDPCVPDPCGDTENLCAELCSNVDYYTCLAQ